MRDASRLVTRGMLPAMAAVVVLQALLVAGSGWPPSTGEFWGPDSYMRLARTLACRGGAGCPGGLFTDSNAPIGEVLHWPFLQDRILLGVAAPLVPTLGWERSVLTAASLLGPMLLIGAIAWVLVAARKLVPPPGLYFVGFLLVFQPWVFQAFAVPQADHHALQGAAYLMMVAGAVRLIVEPADRRWALIAGGSLGLALWSSTEALISTFPILLGLALYWVVRGGSERARINRTVFLAAATVLIFALLVDPPPDRPLAVLYDRFSIVHCFLFLLVGLAWWVVEAWERRAGMGRWRRLLTGAAAVLSVSAGMALMFPGFFGGPMAGMDSRLPEIWLEHTSEFVPVVAATSISVVVLHLASSALALPAALTCALRVDRERACGWALLVGTLFWFLGLTLFVHGRWAFYLHLLVPIPLGWLTGRVLLLARRIGDGPTRAVVDVGSVSIVALAPVLLAVPFAHAEETDEVGRAQNSRCVASSVVPFLRKLEQTHGPGIILAPADWGSEIVFRTRHRAVASPYHRNAAGLLDSHSFMAAVDLSKARDVAERRAIDWVVACTARSWFPVVQGDENGTLYSRLRANWTPAWLTPVALPDSMPESLRIFAVVPEG